MNYSIFFIFAGIVFVILGLLLPVSLENCSTYSGNLFSGGCGFVLLPVFTINLESALVVAWGFVMILLGILALLKKI